MTILVPHDDKTFCNVAVRELSEAFGYKGFTENNNANDMINVMSNSPCFKKVSWAVGVEWAQNGGVAILAKKYSPHGHVASISPEYMRISPSLGSKVPVIANVGKTNGRILASAAFTCMHNGKPIQGWEPDCFILK